MISLLCLLEASIFVTSSSIVFGNVFLSGHSLSQVHWLLSCDNVDTDIGEGTEKAAASLKPGPPAHSAVT